MREIFRPTVSSIIRRYYKNIGVKTDGIKEEASPFRALFHPELIMLKSRNNKILKYLSVSMAENYK